VRERRVVSGRVGVASHRRGKEVAGGRGSTCGWGPLVGEWERGEVEWAGGCNWAEKEGWATGGKTGRRENERKGGRGGKVGRAGWIGRKVGFGPGEGEADLG
jgi:hypothetical protein